MVEIATVQNRLGSISGVRTGCPICCHRRVVFIRVGRKCRWIGRRTTSIDVLLSTNIKGWLKLSRSIMFRVINEYEEGEEERFV